ncbi:MAG: hypothetical protein IT365_04040, partial [Candidatus Hydrogenedentes bacterium]|nr:hypothetical protein [Candidatus Hydrogenedentota bacterium]
QAFVSRLSPSQNALRSHVLYHRLEHDRSQGIYDKKRFLEYLKIPRQLAYVNPQYLRDTDARAQVGYPTQDFSALTSFGTVESDEELVRQYLAHFFETDSGEEVFAPYVREVYLRQLFAETKLLQGAGDMEEWYSRLDPAVVDALKSRVDVEFVPENKARFAPDEEVSLALWIKNVDRLLVKVFEIDELNYFQRFNQRVNTNIDLDGLVPNQEEVYTYTDAPMLRTKRSFAFPQLKGRGVWVIEFVGNGKSSRAVIEKGRLQFVSRTGAAGQRIAVLDELGQQVPDATVWFSGKTYTPNEKGEIILPFSTEPGEKPIVLCQGDFASLDTFQHEAEEYSLAGAFHVETESLQAGEMAEVAVRPSLYLGGAPMPLSLIKNPVLTVHSTTHDGIDSVQEVPDFPLHNDELSIHEFRVPENLATLAFALSGSIDRLTNQEPLNVRAEQTFPINGIHATQQMASIMLTRYGEDYALELRDKTGLPLPDRAVHLDLVHADFTDSATAELKTGSDGRVALGPLQGIVRITAMAGVLGQHSWDLTRLRYRYPNALHGNTQEGLLVPIEGEASQSTTLTETRGGQYVRSWTSALQTAEGYLRAQGLPAGDYVLHLKTDDQRISVRLTEGAHGPFFVASASRALDTEQPAPIQITDVKWDDANVTIALQGTNDYTRVHVVATRFLPDQRLSNLVDATLTPNPGAKSVLGGYAVYHSGRDIGDEYRYILERRFAAKYPGNMLERPSLLLNPWAIQETQAEQKAPEPPAPPPPPAALREAEISSGEGQPGREDLSRMPVEYSPSYDFLGGEAAVFYNLKPDAQGVITLARGDLHGRQYLQIVATDPLTTVSKDVALPEQEIPVRDLRMARTLNPQEHFVEQKRIRVLDKGETLTVSRTGEAYVQTYDTILLVYGLYATLHRNPHFQEFEFITRWPGLTPEEKRSKFSKYASHELNFFLYRKDPEFFQSVVRPFIQGKPNKTFMDRWLLEEDLSGYLEPWRYDQLNVVERILLAKRVADELPRTRASLRDAFELITPDPNRFNHLFTTALYGSSLSQRQSGLQNVQVGGEIGVRGNYFADVNVIDDGRSGGFGGGGGVAGNGGFSPSDSSSAPAEMPALETKEKLSEEGARRAVADRPAAAGKPVVLDSEQLVEANLGVRLIDVDGDGTLETIPFYTKPDGTQVADLKYAREFDTLDREQYRRLYQAVEKTKEWVENNYYKLPLDQAGPGLIPVNAFWLDYADNDWQTPFHSVHLAEATGTFTEMMFALSVLDLPFEQPEHTSETTDAQFTLTAGGPLVAFYKEVESAAQSDASTQILVSQNYFRVDDRYRFEGNQQYDKFIQDEFLSGVVYGCQVTVTNPTSTPHQIEVLRQVPEGAIPVAGGRYTKSERMNLEPYSTVALEYDFYFPKPGDFAHYPVHVSEEGALLASVDAKRMNVLAAPSGVDTTSWQYVSQQAPPEAVLEYLRTNNIHRFDVEQIAWRMRDRAFYDQVMTLLKERHARNPVLWSFAVYHNDTGSMRTYLQYRDEFVGRCGPALDSPLLAIDPVARRAYQHVEYAPLINPRAHDLDHKWSITNEQLTVQYASLMNILAHRGALDQEDLMAVTYYLLLQDRVADALNFFERVTADTMVSTLPHDYFKAYFAFYKEDVDAARQIAERYMDYPVERWASLFQTVRTQAEEIAGAAAAQPDASAYPMQDRLAAEAPRLEIEVKEDAIVVNYSNLKECTLSFYPIDLEMLFTRSPFAPAESGVFESVKPAATQQVSLDANASQMTVPLPAEFASSHVAIEVEAGGISRSAIRYASGLVAQLTEAYGQVHVADAVNLRPLSKVYVKVFARMQGGETVFFRDGYTDLRGRFDYASTSTLNLDDVAEFAILVLDETHGAKVLTASPPAR